jgi:phage tail sheath gpL-like
LGATTAGLDADTFVVGAQTFTWKTARAVLGDVEVGAGASDAVTNIVTAITADLSTVTAAGGAGDTVVLTAATKGTAGDAIVLAENSTNMTVDGTGTLGATTAGVDGTVGVANEIACDGSYLYICTDTNTISGANWRQVSLGTVY